MQKANHDDNSIEESII